MGGKRDSNSRPSRWQRDALPTKLFRLLVVRGGIELPTRGFQSAALPSDYLCGEGVGFEPRSPA